MMTIPLETPSTIGFPKQTQECLEKYQELKTGKKLSYVIYGLSDDKKNIVVLKSSTDKDFDTFVAELPEKECRWAVYDFEFTLPGGEGIRNKLTFVQWCVFLFGLGSLLSIAYTVTRWSFLSLTCFSIGGYCLFISPH